MTTLLLTGGHSVHVKTPADEVEARLRKAGWPTRHYDYNMNNDEIAYTYVQPEFALFEPVKGRHPVRVRTDAVVAIA